MAKTVVTFDRFIGGIADFDKESMIPNSFAWSRSIDFRSNPRKIKILPKTTKESGSVYQGLPKWFDRVSDDVYAYDDAGNLYKRTSAASHSLIRAVANSHGNGLAYYGEDDHLYYTLDKVIGRYGQFSGGSPTFADDFLGSQGGVPTNTNSLDLEASSSQYATAADSASLSITGDLALEAYIKPESLPAVGSSMSLMAKWDESGTLRSYMFEIYAISGYFGDGSDGAYTVSSNTTDAPIDSAASGTLDTYSLSATNASFAAGQVILIHQSQGTSAGTWQRTKIVSYTAGTITTDDKLNYSYSSSGSNKAQVLVLKQYTNVTINSAITLTAKAWDGTSGGILGFIHNGTLTVTGHITATGKGYRGGAGVTGDADGYQGESTAGLGVQSRSANSQGGGGGDGDAGNRSPGGAGGGHAASGTNGSPSHGNDGGVGGSTGGTTDLTTMIFGGGGGGGARAAGQVGNSGTGGAGGGIIFITGVTITITGSVTSNGSAGSAGTSDGGGGGGGAGGSILLKAQVATLGTILITATAGAGGDAPNPDSGDGGDGSVGRIHLDYLTSYTGTTSPTIDPLQDNTLVTTTSYQLRLRVSSNGTNSEILSRVSSIATGSWYRVGVSWDASASTATFFQDGVSLGTSVGAFTAIHNNASLFYLGAYLNSGSAATSFFDGLVDDVRVWNSERTEGQIAGNKDLELASTTPNLMAYWKLNSSESDTASSPDADNLTLVASPTYSSDVPFFAPTTRLDKDQEDTASGNTYAITTSINEGSTHRQTFVPAKDPQKSIIVNISAKGTTSDWTLTVHDALNRTIASATMTNANLVVGNNEFTFSTPWTPIIGVSYHFHLTVTSTTGTPAVVSGTASDLETGQFSSYYQFLVTDTEWHPIVQFINFLAIGNGRYLATYDGSSYDPHRLTLPPGYRVRCYGFWNEYIAIGTMRGDAISDYDQGMIFFWDGISDTYNFVLSVPEGGINAMLGSTGELHIIAGYQGDHLVYRGGSKAVKTKRVPKMTNDMSVEIFPGAMTMWRTLLHYGVAGACDSTVVERGVYSWGSTNENYPNALSYDYPISTGTRTTTTTKVGAITTYNKKLLIGWQDGVSYGVDVVDPAGSPFATATIEFLVRDEGGVWKGKMMNQIVVDYEELTAGHTITPKYRLDRATAWTNGDAMTSTSDDDTVQSANKGHSTVKLGRHREYQLAIDLATTISTSPSVLSLALEEDVLTGEKQL